MKTIGEQYPAWPRQLAAGLDALQVTLDRAQQDALLGFLGLLRKWNRAYNLTAIRDPASMVARQLLDSLSILRWIDRGPVLDVGTGAGLPGLPLAIACPALAFTLLDSNRKKTRFLQQAVAELGLANVEVMQSRAEQFDRPAAYPLIVSRAFASLGDMLAATAALLAADGRWLAMKGHSPVAEIAALPADIAAEVVPLQMPGEAAQRHLVILRRDRP